MSRVGWKRKSLNIVQRSGGYQGYHSAPNESRRKVHTQDRGVPGDIININMCRTSRGRERSDWTGKINSRFYTNGRVEQPNHNII